MYQVMLEEATTQLSNLIAAATKGEVVFITIDGQQAVRLVPVVYARQRRQFGSAKGLIISTRHSTISASICESLNCKLAV